MSRTAEARDERETMASMGRRRIKRKGLPKGGRPSVFFIIMLILGLALVAFFFTQLVSHPAVPH